MTQWNPEDAMAVLSETIEILSEAGVPINPLTVRAYLSEREGGEQT